MKVDEHGFIAVDQHMRTNVPTIFAIGDVVEADLEPYVGPSGEPTQLVGSVFSTIPGSPAYVGKATRYRQKSPELGQDIDISGHNAISGPFVFEDRVLRTCQSTGGLLALPAGIGNKGEVSHFPGPVYPVSPYPFGAVGIVLTYLDSCGNLARFSVVPHGTG
mgnify:CR=1 FL=1